MTDTTGPPIDPAVLARLEQIRQQDELKLKPLKYLRETFRRYEDADPQPLVIRPYQIQGAMHLVAMPSFLLGDDTGTGKTITTITALCCMWERDPNLKVLVLTTKSSVPQWEEEILRFTEGVEVFTVHSVKTKPALTKKPLKRERSKKNPDKPSEYETFCKLIGYDTSDPKGLFQNRVFDILSRLWKEADHHRYKKRRDPDTAKFALDLCRKKVNGKKYTEEDRARLKATLKERRFVPTPGRTRRAKVYDKFIEHEGPCMLVMTYRKAVLDISALDNDKFRDFLFVCDEATAFKTPNTDTHQACALLAERAGKTWALTATFIENRLMEGFGIFKIVAPGLFPNKRRFMFQFGVVRQVPIGKGRFAMKVVDHTPDQIEDFKEHIDPFFLGRAKHDIATDLPSVVMREVDLEMTKAQRDLYEEALTGLLEVGTEDGIEEREVTKLTSINYCQQIIDHPELIGRAGGSVKLDWLLDTLTGDNDLAQHKVIIFNRFEKMISILEREFNKRNIPNVRVTGKEGAKKRGVNLRKFQNPKDETRVIFITEAGTEALNLQIAKAMIFTNRPLSGGKYLQGLGRNVRIGSEHDMVYAIHLSCRGTMDRHIRRLQDKKLKLMEAVMGQRLNRIDAEEVGGDEDIINLLFDSLMQDALEAKRGKK